MSEPTATELSTILNDCIETAVGKAAEMDRHVQSIADKHCLISTMSKYVLTLRNAANRRDTIRLRGVILRISRLDLSMSQKGSFRPTADASACEVGTSAAGRD